MKKLGTTKDNILEVINDILIGNFLVIDKVNYETPIEHLSLNIDSIEFTELIMELEIEYQIIIPDRTMKFDTIGSIVDFIYKEIN